MYYQRKFKKAAAMAASIMIACSSTAGVANAVDTTIPAETSTTSAETSTTAVSVESTTESAETIAEEEEKEIEWYKAELDDYDDSLPLSAMKLLPKRAETLRKKVKSPLP